MQASISAPLLSRVKSWQLIGLGVSGWVSLYSAAILSWGASSAVVGNTQGGCFAITMTLASLEAKRFKKAGSIPADPLQWTGSITTEQLNRTITQLMQEQEFRVEAAHPIEAAMGFGVRAVRVGRTWVFETGRWNEPVINLLHAKVTEENRKKVCADFAIIVGTGTPDEDTQIFMKTHPIHLLAGTELKNLLIAQTPPVQVPETTPNSEPQSLTVCNNELGHAAIQADT